MKHTTSKFQRGQAMAEFAVAMLVLMPLILGIIYMGKFADIKHQVIQASRFAAFERAIDPSPSAQEVDPTIQEETRARFFTDASQHPIGNKDSTSGLTTASSENPLWGQLDGEALIDKYSDVKVALSHSTLGSGAVTAMNDAGQLYFSQHSDGMVQADVSVPVVNIASLPAPLNALNLNIASTTVVGGDAWNAGGAQSVINNITVAAVPMKVASGSGPLGAFAGALNTIASVGFCLLAGTQAPQFGLIEPDVVPTTTAPGESIPSPGGCP